MAADHLPEEALMRAMRPGSWDWNIRDDLCRGDDRLGELLGVSSAQLKDGIPLDRVLQAVHMADRADLYAALSRSIEFTCDYNVVYRVNVSEEEHWIHAFGRCFDEIEGKRHLGIALDVTGLRTDRPEDVGFRMDSIAQHCLKAYSLSDIPQLSNFRQGLGQVLRRIGQEIARSVSRH